MIKKIFTIALLLLMVSVANSQKPSTGGSSFSSGSRPSGSSFTPSFSSRPSPTTSTSTSSRPNTTSSAPKVDRAGVAAQQQAQSAKAFKQATAPKTTYTDKKTGTTKVFSTNDNKRVETIRTKVTPEKYATRTNRVEHHYHHYTNQPTVHYSDPFGPFFYLWLLDQSLDERAAWAYHHQHDMDHERYQDMLKKDAQLEARIKQLEQEKLDKNPNYTPKELENDPDLMYNDEYVSSAFNPEEEKEDGWYLLFNFLIIGVVLVILGVILVIGSKL